MTPELAIFKLAYQISPIILVDGIASFMPFSSLPIIALTQGPSFVQGLLSGNSPLDLDQYFAHFKPLPNATLVDQDIAMYPFANQTVAANAVISKPLEISMLMECPVRGHQGYVVKLATILSLKAALDQHNLSGGTYTVATPSYFYTNCLMRAMVDVSQGDTNQTQTAWRLDFVRPLLTLQDAQQAQQRQNGLMSQITSGLKISGTPSFSGLASTVGQAAPGLASIVPSASSAAGTAVSGVTGAIKGLF